MELVVVVPPGTVVVVLMVLVVAEPTCTTISLDGALEPHAFVARRRAKYRPGGATAEIDVAVLPVSKLKRFVRPAADPTSSTYDVGPPAAAFHVRSTLTPLTAAAKPPGEPGGPAQPPTRTTIPFEGTLRSEKFGRRGPHPNEIGADRHGVDGQRVGADTKDRQIRETGRGAGLELPRGCCRRLIPIQLD